VDRGPSRCSFRGPGDPDIAGIVKTVTIDPPLESAISLALIVVVRTFLSSSLEIELDVVPWRRRTRGSGDVA
jgi:hypothetical protein